MVLCCVDEEIALHMRKIRTIYICEFTALNVSDYLSELVVMLVLRINLLLYFMQANIAKPLTRL